VVLLSDEQAHDDVDDEDDARCPEAHAHLSSIRS
jgi:hypothetical protein